MPLPGPLKLKGQPVAGGVKKKKKHQKEKELAVAGSAQEATDKQEQGDGTVEEEVGGAGPSSGSKAQGETRHPDLKRALHGYELNSAPDDETVDRRTPAEKRFEEHQIKLEQERQTKKAGKSHRDRVKEFNDYLAQLSVSGNQHTHMCARARTHTHTHTVTHTQLHTHIHAHTHILTHTYTHTHTYYTHTHYTHTQTHAHTHTCTSTSIYTHIHTSTHEHTHANNTHVHTYLRMYPAAARVRP